MVKNPPAMKETQEMQFLFDSWVGNISSRRRWKPTPVFLLGKSHGQKSLVGYSPWGSKESGMNEHMHACMHGEWMGGEMVILFGATLSFLGEKVK